MNDCVMPKIGDRIMVKRIPGGYRIKKPEPGVILDVLVNSGKNSYYTVQLDRDRKVDDTWDIGFYDFDVLANPGLA